MGTGLEIAALAIAAVGAAASVKNAIDAKGQAKDQKRLQKEQARIAARQAEIKAQREDRRRRAAIVNASASNEGVSSVTAGALLAGRTSLSAQQDAIGTSLSLQEKQFNIQYDNTVAAANAQIGQAIGSFASTALTPYGQDDKSLVERAFG